MVVIVPRKFDEDMKNHVYMQIEAGSNGNNNYPNIHDNEDIDAAKLLAVGGGIVTSIIFQGTFIRHLTLPANYEFQSRDHKLVGFLDNFSLPPSFLSEVLVGLSPFLSTRLLS